MSGPQGLTPAAPQALPFRWPHPVRPPRRSVEDLGPELSVKDQHVDHIEVVGDRQRAEHDRGIPGIRAAPLFGLGAIICGQWRVRTAVQP